FRSPTNGWNVAFKTVQSTTVINDVLVTLGLITIAVFVKRQSAFAVPTRHPSASAGIVRTVHITTISTLTCVTVGSRHLGRRVFNRGIDRCSAAGAQAQRKKVVTVIVRVCVPIVVRAARLL